MLQDLEGLTRQLFLPTIFLPFCVANYLRLKATSHFFTWKTVLAQPQRCGSVRKKAPAAGVRIRG